MIGWYFVLITEAMEHPSSAHSWGPESFFMHVPPPPLDLPVDCITQTGDGLFLAVETSLEWPVGGGTGPVTTSANEDR